MFADVEGELDLETFGHELQEKSLQLTRDILVETPEEMDEQSVTVPDAGQLTWWSKRDSQKNCCS